MIDGNLAALKKYEEQQEHGEKAQENFLNEIEEYIVQIEEATFSIRGIAEKYEGYDLEDITDEAIDDAIYPTLASNKIAELSKIKNELKELLK